MSSKSRIARATWFDNFIGFFSPKRKLNRLRYKYISDILQRKYEGADGGRRTKGWCTTSKSANAEIAPALSKLRDRSRDLVRNNPYAARGVEVITSNTIGHGIYVDFRDKNKNRTKLINDIWKTWSQSVICDYDGVNNFDALQRLVLRTCVEGGETLVRKRNVSRQKALGPDGVEREVPAIKLQVLEGDFLNSNLFTTTPQGSNSIIQGIEVDSNGKRIAYHLYEQHPGGYDLLKINSFKTNRILSDNIAHVFRVDRPGQMRGVPWLSNIMLRLHDFDEYEDAQLVRQKIAAMFVAFVHDLSGIDNDISTEEREQELGEKMEPGIIELLPTGKDVKLANPPGVENYKEYTSTILHSIAAGFGITYESLTNDFSEVNFSSARMGKLEMWKNIDSWLWHLLIPQFMDPVIKWFLEGVQVLGINTQNVVASYTPPKREMVDPTKEVPALQKAVRSGFITLSEAIRQTGNDPDLQLEELSQDFKKVDDLGLTLDVDARKIPKL